VNKVEDRPEIGDCCRSKFKKIDPQGKVGLSRKDLLEKPKDAPPTGLMGGPSERRPHGERLAGQPAPAVSIFSISD